MYAIQDNLDIAGSDRIEEGLVHRQEHRPFFSIHE
jgi:hypothetical protein